MNLIEKLKGTYREIALAGVLALPLINGGCAMEYKGYKENVSASALIVPFAAGGVSFRHNVYSDLDKKNIEFALDSDVVVTSIGTGTFKMKIHGKDRKLEWAYQTDVAGKNMSTLFYNAEGKEIDRIEGVICGLPTAANFTNHSGIEYRDGCGHIVGMKGLQDLIPKKQASK